MSKRQISDQYKADMAACKDMKDNAKDVCEAEAKAKRDMADADREAHEKKMEAQHDVAKAKCGALSGDARSTCMKEAKAQYSY
jgi:hypothetical protein